MKIAEDGWIKNDPYNDTCPVDEEQRVQVKWRDGSTTIHRAGAFNWDMVHYYRLLPNAPHARS